MDVYFTNNVDIVTASDVNSFSIFRTGNSSTSKPERVYFDPNSPNKVRLFLSMGNRLYVQNSYELRVSNSMTDYLGNGISVNKKSFKGTSKETSAINMSNAIPISTDSIKLVFTKEIAYDMINMMPSNYTLEYLYNDIIIKKIPVCIIYIDPMTVILKFDSFEYDTDYKIKISNTLDYTGSTVKALEKNFKLLRE